MNTFRIDLWDGDEYSYPRAFGFRPNLHAYLHDEDAGLRPCMIIVPGGAYCHVSLTEGELPAMAFYKAGWQCFVLTYTVNAFGLAPAREQPLRDLSRAVRTVRARAVEWHLDPKRTVLCGFSAGGHLAGSLAVHWDRMTDAKYPEISSCPDAAVLSYPVITTGVFAHRGSFEYLLGKDATPAELADASLETQVRSDTPPLFLWSTVTDASVPCENSEMMADACRKAGVPHALHIFSSGKHGLSVATEAWARGEFGENYCGEQWDAVLKAAEAGDPRLSPEQRARVREECRSMAEWRKTGAGENQANAEVSVWPELAVAWLKAVLG